MSQTVTTVMGVIEIEFDCDRLACFVDADCLPDVESELSFNWSDALGCESGRQLSSGCDSNADDSIAHEPVLLLAADLATLRRELAAELIQFRDRLQRAKRVEL